MTIPPVIERQCLVNLTQNKVAIIDAEDFERVNLFKWYAEWSPITNQYRAARTDENRNHVYLHRFIMNPPDGMHVDHINHDTLDNRKDNLRICSQSNNNKNQRIRCDNTSGYKGVTWDKQHKKWKSQISKNGKMKTIGMFDNKISAAIAYDAYAIEIFGEFANLNFNFDQHNATESAVENYK